MASRFCRCLNPREFPVFMQKIVPELEANDGLRLWYRYLNCGFRLPPATAGTDKMTTFVTVGANRVFARIQGEFTYQNSINALKDGRTFVTNSPVLAFTVNGHDPGATLRIDSKKDKIAQVMPWPSRSNCRTIGWRSWPIGRWWRNRLRAEIGTRRRSTWSTRSNKVAGWRRGFARIWTDTAARALISKAFTFQRARG